MKFKEFGLLNFGKFDNNIISFSSGINVIFGENEFGKSTIANFIDGIFYGFSRDSLKRRIRDELFDKCRPWKSSSYDGYIEIEINNETYRITKNFETDDLSILNKSTGLDLSHLPELNKYSRVDQPGALLFDINRKIFKSTVFIGQMMSIPEDDASSDLKKRINNFATSLDEKINLNKVVEKMNNDINSFGTGKRKSSLIGSTTVKIDRLNREKTSYILDKENYDKNIEILKIQKEELKSLQKKYRGRRSFDILELEKQIENLENEKNKTIQNLNMEDFQEAIEINRDLRSKSNRLDDLLSFDKIQNADREFDTDVEKDIKEFKKAKYEISKLNIFNYSKEMEFISVDMRNTQSKINFYILKIILGIILGLGIIGLSIFFNKVFYSLISVLFFAYSYFRYVKYNINKDLYNRLDLKLKELKKLSIEKTGIKREYDVFFDDLMKKYSTNSVEELEDIFEKANMDNLKLRSQMEYNLVIQNKNEKEKILLEKSIQEEEKKLKVILDKYNVANISKLRELFFSIKDDRNEIFIAKKKDELKKLKDNFTVGEIYNRESLEELSKKIKDKLLEISNTSGKVSSLEASVERLRSIEESEMALEKQKSKLKNKRDTLIISRDKLLELVNKNRDNYLPKLKNNMEDILTKITDNKYEEIIIDKDFNIKVYDKVLNKYVDAENVSFGTIDQIYFAFRMAMAKIMTEDKLPIVLDGHFDSYDDTRLANTLEFLRDYEQVLIFTSSKREIEIMNDKNINYNLINLG
ncbi:uncharacterized protein YhaN [Peptoniphilus olsenii]|uniref:Uncharacterized protein YhaN n=1 Tax=Peptoniphilus olsenii TaxID=411570 RepID=A0ABV2J994_9FIRM